jgi:hypothetical protein
MNFVDDIAICVIANDSYKEYSRFIEFMNYSANYPFKYYILDNGSQCQDAIYVSEKAITENKGVLIRLESPIKLSKCYNKLLNMVQAKYCAFVPINNILSIGWIQVLLSELKRIDNSGCASIKSQNQNLFISGLLIDENIKLYYHQKNGNVSGILFSETNTLKSVGGFDETINIDGMEFEEISHRVLMQGKINFYAQFAKRIEIHIDNSILFPACNDEMIINFRNKIEENFKLTQNGKH